MRNIWQLETGWTRTGCKVAIRTTTLQQSVRLKHRAYEVAAKISEYESWEMVPHDVLQEADQQASAKVNKLLRQDQTVLWSLPPDALQLQAQFRLSEELTSAARKKRSAAQKDIEQADAMPRVAGLCAHANL